MQLASFMKKAAVIGVGAFAAFGMGMSGLVDDVGESMVKADEAGSGPVIEAEEVVFQVQEQVPVLCLEVLEQDAGTVILKNAMDSGDEEFLVVGCGGFL